MLRAYLSTKGLQTSPRRICSFWWSLSTFPLGRERGAKSGADNFGLDYCIFVVWILARRRRQNL